MSACRRRRHLVDLAADQFHELIGFPRGVIAGGVGAGGSRLLEFLGLFFGFFHVCGNVLRSLKIHIFNKSQTKMALQYSMGFAKSPKSSAFCKTGCSKAKSGDGFSFGPITDLGVHNTPSSFLRTRLASLRALWIRVSAVPVANPISSACLNKKPRSSSSITPSRLTAAIKFMKSW